MPQIKPLASVGAASLSVLALSGIFAERVESADPIAASAALASSSQMRASGKQKSRQSKKQTAAYLGETAKSAFARDVRSRIDTASRAPRMSSETDRVVFWFNAMLDSCAIDHTPDPDTGDVDFTQGGPTRASRAFAIVQIAVFDAINAFDSRYVPYNDEISLSPGKASRSAAIAYAAHDTLAALYPEQTHRLAGLLASDLEQLTDSRQKIENGRAVGQAVAAAMLLSRNGDNSNHLEPAFGAGGQVADGFATYHGAGVNDGSSLIGNWRPDPVDPAGDDSIALGAYWGAVTPFALQSGDQFRSVAPPPPTSNTYSDAYAEVAAIGGSPDNTGTASTSTAEKRFIGNYWGYDAVPLLGIPPRLYNLIALQSAVDHQLNDPVDLARFLALVNVGMADSGVGAWDSKYFYNYWRPVTGIRESDGNADTVQDETWLPVGVSVINTTAAIRPTPPFPAYPSGHATFGAATFEILRQYFGDKPFTFVSEEYDGEGFDPFTPDTPRPLVPVRFGSFTAAQEENGASRIYNGVHWNFDNVAGQVMGVKIANHILEDTDAFSPVDRRRNKNGGGGRKSK